jgi:hypothetical protein
LIGRADNEIALAEWERKLLRLGDLIQAASHNSDWTTLDETMQQYSMLLFQPPAVGQAKLKPIYESAARLTAELRVQALAAREKVAIEVRHVGRGRKAVSAYS